MAHNAPVYDDTTVIEAMLIRQSHPTSRTEIDQYLLEKDKELKDKELLEE